MYLLTGAEVGFFFIFSFSTYDTVKDKVQYEEDLFQKEISFEVFGRMEYHIIRTARTA